MAFPKPGMYIFVPIANCGLAATILYPLYVVVFLTLYPLAVMPEHPAQDAVYALVFMVTLYPPDTGFETLAFFAPAFRVYEAWMKRFLPLWFT